MEGLDGVHSFFTCDHANNYVRPEGNLPDDKEKMLAEVDAFLALPEDVRQRHYEVVGSQI